MRTCRIEWDASWWGTRPQPCRTWGAGVKNGVLLGPAEAAGFEVLLTRDRGMQYQQNVPALGLAVIVLPVANKKLETMRVLIPKILAALDTSPCRALQPARSAALTMPPA